MKAPQDQHGHVPNNAIVWVLLALAVVAVVVDLMDGYWAKTASSLCIVVGLVAFLYARRYQSSRWRVVMLMAFTLAVAALLGRLAVWQGWI